MYSVELMEEAEALASRLGWRIRRECLGETAGGGCEIGGRKWIFVDLALSPIEQFDQVIEALRNDPSLSRTAVPPCLKGFLEPTRRAA